MALFDTDKVKKFYSISFKVKQQASEFGVQKELVWKFINEEFGVVSEKVVERYFNELIHAKFLIAGNNGLKANSNLEKEYDEFRTKYGAI